LRLKTLLPESSLPGLFLAASALILPFFVLPFFVLLIQVASSPLLIGGMALLIIDGLASPFFDECRESNAPSIWQR
jgi:hypothetical protein